MELEWADQLNMDNMDRKPAEKIDPIKTSHLEKRLRETESELQVDMRPIHQLSAISKNPFSTEALKVQSSRNSILLGKETLGLLKAESIPKALFTVGTK